MSRSFKIIGILICIWAGAFLTSPLPLLGSSKAAQADDFEVHVGKTVEITSSHRYCWFPTIHSLASGAIIVGMQMMPDELNPEGYFSAYCISKDGGETWSRRYTMGASGALCSATHTSLKDGKVWELLTYPVPYPQGQSQNFHIALAKFGQEGMEVEVNRDMILHLASPANMAPVSLFDRRVPDGKVKKQLDGMPWGPIIEALNGDLLAPFYYRTGKDPRFYRTILLRSTDKGKTWNDSSTIAAIKPNEQPWPWMGKEGPCEPGMARLADKRLCVVFRTSGDGYLGETWSSDDGKTWTPPVSTGFKGVAPAIHRLSNGMLALTTGRPGPITIRFNLDGSGKTWTPPTTLFTGKSTHYTDFMEVAPGKILVVYDSIPNGWYPIPFADRKSRNRIYGTFVEVGRR